MSFKISLGSITVPGFRDITGAVSNARSAYNARKTERAERKHEALINELHAFYAKDVGHKDMVADHYEALITAQSGNAAKARKLAERLVAAKS